MRRLPLGWGVGTICWMGSRWRRKRGLRIELMGAQMNSEVGLDKIFQHQPQSPSTHNSKFSANKNDLRSRTRGLSCPSLELCLLSSLLLPAAVCVLSELCPSLKSETPLFKPFSTISTKISPPDLRTSFTTTSLLRPPISSTSRCKIFCRNHAILLPLQARISRCLWPGPRIHTHHPLRCSPRAIISSTSAPKYQAVRYYQMAPIPCSRQAHLSFGDCGLAAICSSIQLPNTNCC